MALSTPTADPTSRIDLGSVLDMEGPDVGQLAPAAPLPLQEGGTPGQLYQLLHRIPEMVLEDSERALWRRAYDPSLIRSLAHEPSVKRMIGRYIEAQASKKADPAAGHASDRWRALADDEVVAFLAAEAPSVIAAVFGSKDAAANGAETPVGHRAEVVTAELLRRHEQDPAYVPLPANLRSIMQVVVPGLCCAALDMERKADIDPTREDAGYALAMELARNVPGFRARAAGFAFRGLARGPDVRLSELLLKNPAMFKEFERKARGGLPEFTRKYLEEAVAGQRPVGNSFERRLLDATMGSPRELNQDGQVWWGDAFKGFPALASIEDLDKGIKQPHRVELPAGTELYHPLAIFHRNVIVSLATSADATKAGQKAYRASLLETIYGLSPESSTKLQQVLLGEAAVVNLNSDSAHTFFEEVVQPACHAGEPLDRGSGSPIRRLLENCVIVPEHSGGVGAELLRRHMERDALRKKVEAKYETGPRGFRLLLEALGADSVKLGESLATQHQLLAAETSSEGLVPQVFRRGELLSVAPERRELIESILVRPLFESLTLKNVPVLRTNGLMPGEEGEAVAQGMYEVQRRLVSKALDFGKRYENPRSIPNSEVADLQTLFGAYALGANCYDALPNKRSVPISEKIGGGLLGRLEGKHGLFRSAGIYGSRMDNSSRLVVLADRSVPVDVIVAPPLTVAAVRGTALLGALKAGAGRDDPTELLLERQFVTSLMGIYARYHSGVELSEMVRRVGAKWMVELGKDSNVLPQMGREIALKFARRMEPAHEMEFRRLFLGEANTPGAFAASMFEQHLAKALLEHGMVKPTLDVVNESYLAVVSRYPLIHTQSFISVRTRVGPPESNTITINPLVAVGLNADFDGDKIDEFWSLPHGATPVQAGVWRAMLEQLSPKRAFLNSGSGTTMMFRISLNAAEGLVKANNVYVRSEKDAGVSPIPFGEAARMMDEALGGRDALLKEMESDPEALQRKEGDFLKRYQEVSGLVPWLGTVLKKEDPAGGDGAEYTTLGRAFLHRACRLIGGDAATDAALGSETVLAQEVPDTSVQAFDRLLLNHVGATDVAARSKEPGDAIAGVYQNFYSFLGAEALSGTMSVWAGGPSTETAMQWVNDQPLVKKMQELFEERILAVERAQTAGAISSERAKDLVLRLESGERGIEEDDFVDPKAPERGLQSGFANLLQGYRSSPGEDAPAARTSVEQFLAERMDDPRYGLKPLLKAAIRFECAVYARETGAPHLLVEQVLTSQVKAKSEVLNRFFMGTANVIDGELVPATKSGLVGPATVARILESGPTAAAKAKESKGEVVPPGVAFKAYLVAMGGIYVTQTSEVGDPWKGKTLDFPVSEYAGDSSNMRYLAHQLTLRRVRVDPSSVPDSAKWDARFQEVNARVPFEARDLIIVLNDLAKAHPDAVLQARTVLFDKDSGMGVSADSVAYLPTVGPGGCKFDEKGGIRRVPMSEAPHLGYPIGAVCAGALAADATQAALRRRHIHENAAEAYTSRADWDRLVHGPFPAKSAYYRQGGECLRTANPLGHPGLEHSRTVFGFAATGVADRPLELVRELTRVAGVELFPGERFYVSGGKAFVGTDRGGFARVSIPAPVVELGEGDAAGTVKLAGSLPAGVEAVYPARVQIQLTADELARADLVFEDPVVEFHRADRIAPGATVLRVGQSTTLSLPTGREDGGVSNLSKAAAALGLSADSLKGRVEVPVGTDFERAEASDGHYLASVLAFRVVSAEPLQLPGVNVPLMPGTIVDPRTGIASFDLRPEQARDIDGFKSYLGFIQGTKIGHPAVLSQYTGSVEQVEYLGLHGEVATYCVGIKEAGTGVRRDQIFNAKQGSSLCVIPGQTIEAGRPLVHGAVDLTQRSRLRGDVALREHAQFLCAFSYSDEGKSLAGLNTDLLARAQFLNGEYHSITALMEAPERRVGENHWLQTGRSGGIEHEVLAAASPVLNPGFGRALAFLPPDKLEELAQIATPAHLFPSLAPEQLDYVTVVEPEAALGLGTALLGPREAAANRAAEHAKAKEKGVGVQDPGLEPATAGTRLLEDVRELTMGG